MTDPALKIVSNDVAPETASRRLRIALFSGNYNYVMDGPVRALNRLVAFLERQGHEALVFAPTVKEPAFKHSGTLISAPSIAFPGRGEYRLALGMSGEIKRRLAALKPDIVHLSAPDYLGYCALRWAQKNDVPAVASFHTRFDTYPRYYGGRWLEPVLTNYLRYFYGRCEHVYAPSQCMVDELREDGFGRDIRMWTRGVDGALFSPKKRDMAWRRSLGFADDDIVVAFVGRLVLEKGIDIFVETLQRTPGVKALVVGEGPERERFEDKLNDGHFAGYLEGEALARAYASADIFFNPSITETFGNVTLEAMASGTPPLCARAAGSASLVAHERTGLLASPSSDAFAAALGALASDGDLRSRLATAARRRSLDYSWNAILNRLVEDYYEAIDAHRANAAL